MQFKTKNVQEINSQYQIIKQKLTLRLLVVLNRVSDRFKKVSK